MPPSEERRQPAARSSAMSVAWQVAGGALGVITALFLVDRALLGMEARGWIYWRRRKGLSALGVDFLQEGDPAARAVVRGMEQERVRKSVRPADEPQPVRVDLETGVVRIRIRPARSGGRKSAEVALRSGSRRHSAEYRREPSDGGGT
ncbi:hypothetical protein [Streptomyces sp. NPDC059076]|uniref:hypothetical protein n=2 Tax=Streptomyces TaxID=1883 RepID=UPI003677B464